MGDLQGFGEVWYHPKGIANILSMALVEEKPVWEITYSKDGGFKVHKSDRSVRSFVRSDQGLFYMDTPKNKSKKPERKEDPVPGGTLTTLIDTVTNKNAIILSETTVWLN